MRGALLSGAPPFIVNLGGRYMPVAEQFLNLANVDAGIQEQGSGGRPQGMRAVEPHTFLDRPSQLCHEPVMTRYMLASLMGLSPSSSLWGAPRARKIGPPASPAVPRYSASASGAAKWMPMVRWQLPFSLMVRVASSPSW
jgi:hypothetical protein